jgi:hypothetical protein
MAKKWIQGAIQHPGALTAKAKAAGKSVSEYCASLGPNADARTKRQCNLFHILRGLGKKRKLESMTKSQLIKEIHKLKDEVSDLFYEGDA